METEERAEDSPAQPRTLQSGSAEGSSAPLLDHDELGPGAPFL